MLGAFLSLIFPKLIGNIFTGNFNYSKILLALVVFLIAYLTQGLSIYFLGVVGTETTLNLENRYISHCLNMNLSTYEEKTAGDLASRLTNDTSQIGNLISLIIPQVIMSCIVVIGSIIILSLINWKLTLLSFFIIPIILLIAYPLNIKIEKMSKVRQELLGLLNNEFIQKINNIKLVKSYLGEKEELIKSKRVLTKISENQNKIIGLSVITNLSSSFFMMCFIILIIVYGGLEVYRGVITVSLLTSFTIYIVQLITPAIGLMSTVSEVFKIKGSINRVREILDMPLEESNTYSIDNINKIDDSSIEINKLTFGYNRDNIILNNINLKINSNSLTAIIGPSGAGKSTLLSIIMKFYPMYIGDVFINNKNIKNIPNNIIRNNISYLTQNNYFFSGTIKDNLLYGKNKSVSEIELNDILNKTGVAEMLNSFENGLMTTLGDNGSGLSEGQKQRLSIVRALLSKPKILLLDEVTSNLDVINEDKIMEHIINVSKDITTIIVAHRLNTIKNAQKIIILDKDGTIENCGTHEELLYKSSIYQSFMKINNK